MVEPREGVETFFRLVEETNKFCKRRTQSSEPGMVKVL